MAFSRGDKDVNLSFSIRKKQIECLKNMFVLNSNKKTTTWKVLIYDEFCRDIIAPLLTVKDLHNEGVTLHMMIDHERKQIPDAPAVYFVQPTEENIKRISQDVGDLLYEGYYLNFVSSVPVALLEKLAIYTCEMEGVSRILKVTDQYCNFLSLEDRLFHLNQKMSYTNFHDPRMSEEEARLNLDKIVDSLFSIVVTLGVIPIIRCPRNDTAEVVAGALCSKIHDHLSAYNSPLEYSAWNRPVLLILDRNIDLSAVLSHGWTYQVLIHDLLDYNLNRVTLAVGKSKELKSFNLDSLEPWWTENSKKSFPQVCMDISQGLEEIAQKYDFDNVSMSKIVYNLSEIAERKNVLSMHMEIATTLLELIKERLINEFFELEESIMTKSALNHYSQVESLLTSSSGTQEDKLRLFLIYFLAKRKLLDKSEISQLENLLTRLEMPTNSFHYIKKIHTLNKYWTSPSSSASSQSTSTSSPPVQEKIFRNEFVRMFGGMLTSGIQHILPINKDFHVTQILDSIMELKESHGIENYLYLDPKFFPNSTPRKNAPFKEAIVFIIGGGNYLEMQNINEYAKRSKTGPDGIISKKIIYGATEMVSPNDFLSQLATLNDRL